jgi:hypothetical protein
MHLVPHFRLTAAYFAATTLILIALLWAPLRHTVTVIGEIGWLYMITGMQG